MGEDDAQMALIGRMTAIEVVLEEALVILLEGDDKRIELADKIKARAEAAFGVLAKSTDYDVRFIIAGQDQVGRTCRSIKARLSGDLPGTGQHPRR